MKKVIANLLFVTFTVATMAQTTKQKTSIPIPTPATKTFEVNEATKDQLPEGVIFNTGKLTAKPGFLFVKNNTGGVNIIHNSVAQKPIGGTFICGCATGSCSVTTDGSLMYCSGCTKCVISTTINPESKTLLQTNNNVQTKQ